MKKYLTLAVALLLGVLSDAKLVSTNEQ